MKLLQNIKVLILIKPIATKNKVNIVLGTTVLSQFVRKYEKFQITKKIIKILEDKMEPSISGQSHSVRWKKRKNRLKLRMKPKLV